MTRTTTGIISVLMGLVILAGCASSPARVEDTPQRRAARSYAELGLNYLRQGQRAVAMEKLRKAVEMDPSYAGAQHGLALGYQEFGQPDLAEMHFRHAMRLDDKDSNLYNNFGAFLCDQGRYEEADKYFLRAVADPGYGTPDRAWENAGVCALKNNDFDKAETYLRSALKLQPKLSAALLGMARVNYRKKDFLRTRAYLQRYEEVGAPTSETLWLAVQTERNLGDVQAANRSVMLLESKFPDSDEARSLKRGRSKR